MRNPLLACAAAIGALLIAASVEAAELRVLISGGFGPAYKELAPIFEQRTGHRIETAGGPSMGTTQNAIPVRLERGEKADVLIMVGYALDDLIAKGKANAADKVELANSKIGVAVKQGAPKPDISTLETFKAALLAAKSVAYSDSASGVYIEKEMLPKMGIAEALKGRARMIPATPVGEIVARGEAEIGMQQISELNHVAGVELVGELPPEVQKVTLFSASVASVSQNPEAARALIAFLASPEAADAVKRSGIEPITRK